MLSHCQNISFPIQRQVRTRLLSFKIIRVAGANIHEWKPGVAQSIRAATAASGGQDTVPPT